MSLGSRREQLNQHLSNIDEELDRLDREERAQRHRLDITDFNDVGHHEPIDWGALTWAGIILLSGGIVLLSLILHAIDITKWVYHIVTG